MRTFDEFNMNLPSYKELLSSSKKDSEPVYTLDTSDCEYFYAYGRSKKFTKRSNHCTNRFTRCPVYGCISDIWKNNFENHLLVKHPDLIIDEGFEQFPEMKICEEEKNFVVLKKI